MNILYYCHHCPRDLVGPIGGTRRHVISTKAALDIVDIKATFIDIDSYKNKDIITMEKNHELIHCDNSDILCDMLKRSVMPDIVGPHPWAPSKRYTILDGDGYYKYPGYEKCSDLLYDQAIWIRNNLKEERFRKSLQAKVRIVQPSIEINKIYPIDPFNFKERQYILWAGVKKRSEKNWALMQQIMKSVVLPPYFKWIVLENYNIEDYLSLLDKTALMVFTSKTETFGFQLFEAWAKAVPTVYWAGLWGKIPFNGCGGLPVEESDYSLNGFCKKIISFISMKSKDRQRLGIRSRKEVEMNFSPQRHGRELKMIYSQAIESKN